MKDSQILSTFLEGLPDASAPAAARPLVFDACQVGVVLRAVLFVELAVGVGIVFAAPNLVGWVNRLAFYTGGALPATLVWLVAACSLKNVLARLSLLRQQLAGMALGALSGLYACGVLALVGLESAPWLACALSGAALAAVLVAALVARARAITPATTTARLSELQSRIRPHFLFNTLNTVAALVRAEPARAEAMLEDLSDLFRHALMEQGEFVTLADEIALAQRYLAIEQVRFGERIQVEWALDPQASLAKLPPLLLQPLVENAVKHGVEPSDTGAQIRISTERRGARVVVKVTNSVPAGQGQRGNGVALDNVRDRLKLLHDVQGQFQSGLKNHVFQVRIEVPL